MVDAYRQSPRQQYRVVETLNGHLLATCRGPKGIYYLCIRCGFEYMPTCIGLTNLRDPHAIPFPECRYGSADGPGFTDNGWLPTNRFNPPV